MKFIHTADLHLGYKFSSSFCSETLSALKENQKKMLSNLINEANKREVDAILIAGDLFDNENPPAKLSSFAKEEFERANCDIFIVCGNHDPLTSDSVYKKVEFSNNVHIFGKDIERMSFDGFDIYGHSFVSPHKPDNSLKDFKVEDASVISIMLSHADFAPDSFYNPIRTTDIEKSGLSYLALGHIHIDDGIKKVGNTFYGYSGTPQSMTFKETVKAKALYIELSESFMKTEEIFINEHSFESLKVDITGATSDDEVLDFIKEALISHNPSKTLFSITLTGYVEKEFQPDKEILKEKLSSLLYIDIETDLRVKYNIELLKEERSVRGEFVRNAFEMLKGKDEKYIEKVIEYGVNKL